MKSKILNGRKTRNTKAREGRPKHEKRDRQHQNPVRTGRNQFGKLYNPQPSCFRPDLSISPSSTPVKGIATKITDKSLNTRYVMAITSGLFQFHVAGEC